MKLDISARFYILSEINRVLEGSQNTYNKLSRFSDVELMKMYKKLFPQSDQSIFEIDGDYIILR